MMRITVLLIAVALLSATPVSGQAPATGPVAPAATTTPAPAKVPPLEPQGYDYDPAGRRDPFISLVRRTTAASGTSANQRPMGLAGLSVDEIVMRGVVKGNSGWMALVKGVNNRSYLLKVGDELYDGSVRAITADAVLFLQNVNDPLSVARKREVRKPLRPAREAQ
jgi:Tfp pilus assembly protein PilP